ncbi:MAG: hypothetical protein D6816_00975 [Bacteroidetes bacterium]|nr:MAG: hypothetical protein D6816_00975 [Bacteroidota bacterium]
MTRRIQPLKDKFLEFLAAVALRPDRKKQYTPGPDGLYHVNLNSLASGVSLEESGKHGYYSSGRHNFLSLQWDEKSLDAAVTEAKKLCPNVSGKLIKKTLRQLMVNIFEEQKVNKDPDVQQDEEDDQEEGIIDSILEVLNVSQIDALLIDVIEWLNNQAIPQTVYVPIEGIELSGTITIGDVEFHQNREDSELNQLIDTIEKRDQSNSDAARESIENSQCFAKITIEGDGIFARAEAVRKVQEAIHTINFGLSSTLHQPSWAKVRIAQIIINTNTPTDDPNDVRIGLNLAYPPNRALSLSKYSIQENLKPVHRNVLRADPAFVPNWRQEPESLAQVVDQLLACYQTNGDIAKRVQRAITWYGKAVDADTHDEQFVNLAIALESLLIGNEGSGPYTTSGSINQNLGERTAFLLHSDFDARYEQLKRTKRLYGHRSAIVHRGESITVEQLKEMDDLVKHVTIAFLQHNFQSWSDFQEWIARQKFSQKALPMTETTAANND